MKRLFFGAVLLSVFALGVTNAFASPMVETIGAARVTLALTPDPPSTGAIHAIVSVDGVDASVLARTNVSYGSAMPTMAMNGPSGIVRRTGPDRWEFDASLAMATTWVVSLRFSGGISGVATYRFAVAGNGGSSSASAMAGMSSSSGDPDAWRAAALALAVIVIVAVLVLVVRRDRRPLTLAIVAGAAVVVVIFAVVQARYAAPAMDMEAMSSVHGDDATPVTLARVSAASNTTEIHAPGTVSPYLTQDIVVRASGILTDFHAYAGDRLAAGARIATLDAPDLESRAAAAAADAVGARDTAQVAEIDAHHHAPDAVVIAQADLRSLDHELIAAQAERDARAEAARAQTSELGRERTLLAAGAVSAQEFDDARAQAAAARAASDAAIQNVASLHQRVLSAQTKTSDAVASVAQMEAQAAAASAGASRAAAQAATEATLAGFTTVRAPDDVVVVKRLVDPGVYVQAGTPIVRVAVLHRLRVAANVAQEDVASIEIGTPFDARLADGSTIHGRVSSIAPVTDPLAHTASVEAIVDHPAATLIPGGYVSVIFHVRPQHTAGTVQLPSSAIVGSGTDAAVWTDVNGTAHRVPVHVMFDDGTGARVRGDVKATDRVVTDGAATLEEGQSIVASPA